MKLDFDKMNEKDNWWVRREIDLTRQKSKFSSSSRYDYV